MRTLYRRSGSALESWAKRSHPAATDGMALREVLHRVTTPGRHPEASAHSYCRFSQITSTTAGRHPVAVSSSCTFIREPPSPGYRHHAGLVALDTRAPPSRKSAGDGAGVAQPFGWRHRLARMFRAACWAVSRIRLARVSGRPAARVHSRIQLVVELARPAVDPAEAERAPLRRCRRRVDGAGRSPCCR